MVRERSNPGAPRHPTSGSGCHKAAGVGEQSTHLVRGHRGHACYIAGMVHKALVAACASLICAGVMAAHAQTQPDPATAAVPLPAPAAYAPATVSAPAPAPLPATSAVADVAAPGAPFPDNEKDACRWLDVRITGRRVSESLSVIDRLLETETRPEVQWRLTQAVIVYYEARPKAPDAEKLKAYGAAERLMRKCMAAGGPPHCEFFLGATIGRQSTVRGIMSSLRSLRPIESTWLAGLRRTTNHPEYQLDGAPLESYYYYALGMLYRILPDWWIIKLIAGVRGDLDKAIAYQRKSAAMRPEISTQMELGVTLMCSGHKRSRAADMQEGRVLVEGILGMKPADPLDELDQQAARFLLAHPKKTCGYSRDKMQDVDSKP